MSRDLTPEELRQLSDAMVANGYMSYEEFCEELERQGFGVKAQVEE
jgi:polyhydroxyalkanoate synthesis regulator phasin